VNKAKKQSSTNCS